MAGNTQKNELLEELIIRQIKNVPTDRKLKYFDMKRICKFISTSIFDENKCSIWSTYLDDNISNNNIHINFYFNKKKMSLHRLLYTNFIDTIDSTEYIKFTCENKGKCCNIHHMAKFKYLVKDAGDVPIKVENKEEKQKNITVPKEDINKPLKIKFDD